MPSIHGGSLRVFGGHAEDARQTAPSVNLLHAEEARRGLRTLDLYRTFQARADRIKDDLLTFLIEQKRAGRTVAGYGAAAKGNTLLNFAGVKSDLLPFVCDAAPSKQGKFLPGSRIPIVDASHLKRQRPDLILNPAKKPWIVCLAPPNQVWLFGSRANSVSGRKSLTKSMRHSSKNTAYKLQD